MVEYGPDVFIDIEGIQIGDKLTKEDMESHFGELISEKWEVYSFSREVAKIDEESYFIFCVKIKDYVPDYRTYLTIKNCIIICIESWPDFS